MRILFDSKSTRYKEPFGALCVGQRCRLSIDIPATCQTREVQVLFHRENGTPHALFYLEKKGAEEGYETFSCSFSLSEAELFYYHFVIRTENECFPLYRQGDSDTNMCQGKPWQLTVYPADLQTPLSLSGGVMYQIFPDRFFAEGQCDLSGKLEPFVIHSDPHDCPEYRPDETGEVKNCDFFGGNLLGIEKKLDYLASLGVSILYLNPIFKAWSNHRYDTADYRKIDEMLGDERAFSSLCRQAHRRGMRIILDGVFSHTGANSVYFDAKGVFGGGAVSDPASPYRAWFDFQSYPDRYTSWWGIRTLPCVKETEPSFLDYIVENEDSVLEKWMRLGADGWRLDVADELPEAFLDAFRARLKAIRPDALLIGEVWEDASDKISYGARRHYFTHGQLDSVMNYPWREAILAFVGGRDSGEGFCRSVMTIAENYPPQVLPLLMNFLSTHDTPRVLSLFGESEPSTKEEKASFCLSESDRASAEKKLRLASFLQYILPGIPSIYYGDEIGMEGFEDPFCRRMFDWEKKSDLPAFFASLAALREQRALRGASVSAKPIFPGVLRVEREGEGQVLVAFANASQEEVRLSCSEECLLSYGAEQNGTEVTLAPLGFWIGPTKNGH